MRPKSVILVGSVLGVCSFFLARSDPQRRADLAYTLIVEERMSNGLGVTGLVRTRFHALRSDGARASGPFGMDDGSQIREVILPAQAKSILVSDLTRTKCTFSARRLLSPGWTHGSKESRAPYNLGSTCENAAGEKASRIGSETILGFPAYLYDSRQTFVNGDTEELVRWLSPALGCRALRETGRKYDPGRNLIGHFERRVIQIVLGEPEDALFHVPEEYREVSPSEQSLAIHRALYPQRDLPPKWSAMLDRLDRRYQREQAE